MGESNFYKDLIKEATIYEFPATQIYTKEDRQRQHFDRRSMDKMVESIRSVGQLQPGICRKNEAEQYELVVGERRLRACMALQRNFKFCLLEDIEDPFLLEFIQLEENLQRENLDWKEDVRAKARVHNLFTERYGEATPGVPNSGHTIKDTAEHLGYSYSIIQEDVDLANFLEIPEVESAPNKTTAKKIVKRMIEQVKNREKLEKALENVEKLPEEQAPLTEEAKEKKEKRRQAPIEKPVDLAEQLIQRFNQRCILGIMEEKLLDFKDESIDVIFFDPPWGVEFDKNYKTEGSTKLYSDPADYFFAKVKDWLELIYQKMKPDSHLYMFFGMGQKETEEIKNSAPAEGLIHRNFLFDLFEEIGFESNRLPIIWYKKGAHYVRAPHKWPGRSYEPIAFLRKGNKHLEKQGQPDVIITPPTPKLKGIHPSAKHPQVYQNLILRSCKPGDTILDPMAGSGMMGVAAESLTGKLALNWWHIERDQDFKVLQISNLMKGFDNLCQTEGRHIELDIQAPQETPGSFKTLTPGTPEWAEYFKSHPEEQDAMLQYRIELKQNNN